APERNSVVPLPPVTDSVKLVGIASCNGTDAPQTEDVMTGGDTNAELELITNSIAADPPTTCASKRPPPAGGVKLKTPVAGSTVPDVGTCIPLSAVVARR